MVDNVQVKIKQYKKIQMIYMNLRHTW